MAVKSQLPKETEAAFQRALVKMALHLGWTVYHTRFSFGSNRGFPDLVLAKALQPVIFAELKREGEGPTETQEAWGHVLSLATGNEYYVWRPSDWDAIEARLKRE